MSMRFPYAPLRARQPVWPLGGRNARPRPLVIVSVGGPTNTSVQRATLDTGADDTVFEEQVASALGVDLTGAPAGECIGVSGASVPVRYALVTLRLTDGREFRAWPAWVGFTPQRMPRGLLGFAGCLHFFTATFFGDLEQVELTVNGLYPVT